MTSCCFVTAQKAFSVSASLPQRGLVKNGCFVRRTTREIMMPKNKTVPTNGSQGPVTVRGTVPGCNYRDNSCLIIQWGEEPGSPLGGVWVAVRENSLNEGLSSPYITMGLSKLNPPSLCPINKDMNDNEWTMGLLKPKILAHEKTWHLWCRMSKLKFLC